MNDSIKGYLAVAGAALFFGSFAVPLKSKRVEESKIDPVVFQIYYSVSIFCSSWIVLTYNDFVFTYWGIVGAGLWVPASILSIFAIKYLGMSVAVGTWAGVTISFLWGVLVFGDQVKNIYLSILGLVFLIVGICGLSFSDSSYVKGTKSTSLNDDGRPASVRSPLLAPDSEHSPRSSSGAKGKIIGLLCALVLGVLNGSMMVPLHYVPDDAEGISYMTSFGIGVLIVTPVCALFYFLLIKREIPPFHLKVALVPGLLTGLLWNIGNFCSVYATLYLGMTVGYPLTQLALVVSGLYGIFLFHELSGIKPLAVWFSSVTILLGGAVMLAAFGKSD